MLDRSGHWLFDSRYYERRSLPGSSKIASQQIAHLRWSAEQRIGRFLQHVLPRGSVKVRAYGVASAVSLGVLLINQNKKTLQLLPTIDRLTELPCFNERAPRFESGSAKQPADELQLAPTLRSEAKLVASSKPPRSLPGQTLLCRWPDVSIAAKKFRQLLGDRIRKS